MSAFVTPKLREVMRGVADDLRLERLHEALARIQSLPNESRAVDEVSYCESAILMQMGLWHEALELLDRLADVDSSRPAVIFDLVTCLIELDRDRDALNVLRVNHNIHGRHARYHILLARIAARHSNFEQAERCMSTALNLDKAALRMIRDTPEIQWTQV